MGASMQPMGMGKRYSSVAATMLLGAILVTGYLDSLEPRAKRGLDPRGASVERAASSAGFDDGALPYAAALESLPEVAELGDAAPARVPSREVEPRAQSSRVAGVVLRPNGVPVARALVGFYTREGIELRRWGGLTDAEGRFEIQTTPAGVSGALLAGDYRDALGAVLIEPVRADGPELVVHLGPRRRFELDVRGTGGEQLSDFKSRLELRILGEWTRKNEPRLTDTQVYGLPPVPFRVHVTCSGYEAAILGPLEPADIGAVLRVDLEPLKRARGRITRDGLPVEGAGVGLWSQYQVEADPLELANTHPGRWRREGLTASTDADGRFELALERSGTFDLFASAGKRGDGRLRELVIDAERGVEGLALELVSCGTIRGRLQVSAAHRPSEVWVEFKSDKETFWTGVDDAGTFFVEDLSAGRWELALRERGERAEPFDPRLGSRCWWSHHVPDSPPWLSHDTTRTVELQPGETAELEWDAAAAPVCELLGSLRLDGRALEPRHPRPGDLFDSSECRAWLERDGQAGWCARASIDDDGRFVLGVADPGSYRLRVTISQAVGSQLVALDRVELRPGSRDWDLDLPSGALSVALEAGLQEQRGSIEHRWRGPGELRLITRQGLGGRNGEPLRFPRVPAGPGQVRLTSWGDAPRILAEIEVPVGDERSIELR